MDECELRDGTSFDYDEDGVPDECPNYLARLVAPEPAPGTQFGNSVAFGLDFLAVGASGESHEGGTQAGSVYVFRRVGPTPICEVRLTASDAAADDLFGSSVAVRGSLVVVGAERDDHSAGAAAGSVYVFRRTVGGWVEEAKLIAADAEAGDHFGSSVAVDEERIVVGAPDHTHYLPPVFSYSSVYVFRHEGDDWVQEAELVPSDGYFVERFGRSVSIDGDVIFVGDDLGDHFGVDILGTVYVFRRTGTTWSQEAKLLASNASGADFFGSSVSVSGDWAVVGAINDDLPLIEFQGGSAYIFHYDGNTWVQTQKLTASDGGGSDHFGTSVSIRDDLLAVGAPGHRCDTCAGAVYIYRLNGTTWIEVGKLVAADGTSAPFGDLFGNAVSLADHLVAVGAFGTDLEGAFNAGSAYLFNVEPCPVGQAQPDPLEAGPNLFGVARGGDLNRVGVIAMPASAVAAAQEVTIRIKLVDLYVDSNVAPVNGCPVREADLPDLTQFENQVRYLGMPSAFDDNSASMPKFVAAQLQCDPYYRDWSPTALTTEFGAAVNTSLIYFYGAEVLPCSVYDAQQGTQSCVESANKCCFSTALEIGTALWGDVWDPFGQVNFTDIGKIVDAFKGIAFVEGDPPGGAPNKWRSMLRENEGAPDSAINFTDIGMAVDAFKSIAYQGDGPRACTACP